MGTDEKKSSTSLLMEILGLDTFRDLALDDKILNILLSLGETNKDLKQKCKNLYNSYFDSDNYDFYEAELRVRRLTQKYL